MSFVFLSSGFGEFETGLFRPMRSRLRLFKLEIQKACFFYPPATLFKLMNWHVVSPHLILPVKTLIIFKSLNEVCKQTTLRNVKRDNGCRENKANIFDWSVLASCDNRVKRYMALLFPANSFVIITKDFRIRAHFAT